MFKLALLATMGMAQGKTLWHQLGNYTFADYVAEYNKGYEPNSSEWNERKAIFDTHLAEINAHNADTTKSWKNGVNKFTDLTKEEMKQFKGYNKGMAYAYRASVSVPTPNFEGVQVPDSIDWRTKGVITPVKDQGGCGSCWAFAATETLESHYALKNGGTPPILAPQQYVDCTPNPDHCGGTGGCQGATAQLAYDSIKLPGGAAGVGQTFEKNYPYRGMTMSCQHGKPSGANVTGHTDLPSNDMNSLLNAVATVGPISISMDASWGAYESGVFSGCSKDADIDHAIQLVGYGTDNGKDYWIVRNSWGEGWGERGYIRVERFSSSDAYCGTDHNPSDGSGCSGGPPTVKVCGMCGILYDTTYPNVP